MAPSGEAGVLRIDKPAGPTSHDIVALARRELGVRRIGHAGTLDPFATGLLLLCVGSATRIAEYLLGLPKTYIAEARLGVATDTDDLTGTVVREDDAWTSLDRARVERVLAGFRGELSQVPPQYSAKRVEGERAYRLARLGAGPRLQAVSVTLHAIRLLDWAPPAVRFEVECSSGTYIRALARDVGEALDTAAHLTALRRTAIGGHRIEQAITPEWLGERASWGDAWLQPLEALDHLPRVDVGAEDANALSHGRTVRVSGHADASPVAVAGGTGLLAIADLEAGLLRPRKVLA